MKIIYEISTKEIADLMELSQPEKTQEMQNAKKSTVEETVHKRLTEALCNGAYEINISSETHTL